MAALDAFLAKPVLGGFPNANMGDFGGKGQNDFVAPFHVTDLGQAGYYTLAVASGGGAGGGVALNSHYSQNFTDDFWQGVHIKPRLVDVGNITAPVVRGIYAWNASLSNKTLSGIQYENGDGITDAPPSSYPITIRPNEEIRVDFSVSLAGPPNIRATIKFDFGAELPQSLIIGLRALVLNALPSAGGKARETWKWLTDVRKSVTGVEQRSSARIESRWEFEQNVDAFDEYESKALYDLLYMARGRALVPMWQYAGRLSQAASEDDTSIAISTPRMNLRKGDALYILGGTSEIRIVSAFGGSTIALDQPLDHDHKNSAIVVPAYSCLLNDGVSLTRPHWNSTASVSLTGMVNAYRDIERPGSTATVNTFNSLPLLERRPLANDDIKNQFNTGQQRIDAGTGIVNLVNLTKASTISSGVTFKFNRFDVDEFDYLRAVIKQLNGNLGEFYLSTWRPDQYLVTLGAARSVLVLKGTTYSDDFYGRRAFSQFAIQTAKGIHHCSVVDAVTTSGGDTQVTIDPPLPGGSGWSEIQVISYLMRWRMDGDKVELEHDGYNITLSFAIRSIV